MEGFPGQGRTNRRTGFGSICGRKNVLKYLWAEVNPPLKFFLMRYFIPVMFVMLLTKSLTAQQNHFIYIQSDNEQPFYLKMAGQTYSSSAAGFLILSKLRDTAFEMVLGFPRNQYPEYRFQMPPVTKDRGVALKQFGDKGWGLFDLQTMDIQMGEQVSADKAMVRPAEKPMATDTFTRVLSSVIDDKAIAETELVRNAGVASGSAAGTGGRKDSTLSLTAGSVERGVAPRPDTLRSGDGNPAVNKEISSAVQPEKKSSSTDVSGQVAKKEPVTGKDTVVSVRPVNVVPAESSALGIRDSATAKQSPSVAIPQVAAGAGGQLRKDCRSMVSVKDLGTLRRRMESIADEDAKVAAALREFKASCFTTEQVRSLLVVFYREEGRYKLIDAAYPHVYDPGNYGQLLPLLKDPYFIHRFRRLTGMPVE